MWWATGPKPHGNIGDLVGPYLYGKDRGHNPVATSQRSPDLLTCGSILRFARPGTVVWGSGHMRHTEESCTTARYVAVRGPLTREMVIQAGGSVPYLMCDPAMCLPLVYDPKVDQGEQPAIIPHYTDLDAATKLAKDWGWKVISPLNASVEDFVRRVLACPFVASSSLHGVVIPIAYDIPAVWIVLGDGVNGNGFKFRDFGASVSWRAEPCPVESMAIEQCATDYGLPDMRPTARFDLVKTMWEARPWQ